MINRNEFVRVIIEYLYSLGYDKSASLLESESGIPSKSPDFQLLESQIHNSNWDACIETLTKLDDCDEEARASALFLIFKHSITQLLIGGDDSSALALLRKQIGKVLDRDKVHKLASGIAFASKEDLNRRGRNLLVELEKLLPPPIVVPQRRLEYLVEMAIIRQMDSCTYHNSDANVSLYQDHSCERHQIPTETVQG